MLGFPTDFTTNTQHVFCSDLLHSIWQILGPSMSLQITLFCSFLWLTFNEQSWNRLSETFSFSKAPIHQFLKTISFFQIFLQADVPVHSSCSLLASYNPYPTRPHPTPHPHLMVVSSLGCVRPLQPHVARQTPLSMGFPRQEYWSGLPFFSPGHLPNPGIEPRSLCIAGRLFTNWAIRKSYTIHPPSCLTSPLKR